MRKVIEAIPRLRRMYSGFLRGVLIAEAILTAFQRLQMQSLVEEWRDSIGEHGEMVIYVDNC